MAGNVLTDGQPVSPITWKKLAKDFAADFLIGAAAGVGTAGITGLEGGIAQPVVLGFALANAAIAAGYRVALRVTTS